MKSGLMAFIALLALAVTSAQAQTITVRAEHDEPSGSITDRLLNQMADDISKATSGKIKVEVHSG